MTATGHLPRLGSAFAALCAALALALFSSAALAQAGYVHEISGSVSMQKPGAKSAPAKVGDTFESNTGFNTGADAKVVLKFADGQVLAMGPDSGVHIGEYRYVAHDIKLSSTTVELLHGEMRYVAGLIGAANRDGVHIVAGDSLLRILSPGGADFIVQMKPEPEEIGAAVVAQGQVSVRTPYGPIYRIDAGQYVPWEPRRALPPPMPIAAAPAVLQAAVAELWTTIVPVNTPVAVAATARAAATAAAVSAVQTVASVDTRQIGFVDAVSNAVSVHSPAGRTVNASVGQTFPPGTSFNTGTEGSVVLKFADGQVVVLGPASVLSVDQYHFDPRDLKASSSALDLAAGAMRYVSGIIHAENRDGISISAGASLVDILSSGDADFNVVVRIKGREQEIGIAAVASGAISVHTPYGPISTIKPGEAVPWQPGQAPPLPEPLALAPADSQAAMAALSAAKLPDNAPVLVAAAASAAAAQSAADRAQAAASANPGNAQLRAAAQAAAERASAAAQAASDAAQAVAATVFASTLAALPATAAGPAQAQVPPAAPVLPPPAAPINPTVTPGGGVITSCAGVSPC